MLIPWTLPANQAVAINPNIEYSNSPDHGMEDYEACKKFDIPTFCPVYEFGIFTLEVGDPTFEAQYRLEQFTLSRSEWCISRQRSWGVPIPVFYESETDVPLLTDFSVEHIIEIFKKHGSDGWWKLDDQELLASEYKNNGKTYRKGNDTMDVWFDSGVSWTFILEQTKKKDFKTIADLYLEGSDQHRGWFQSSLLTSVAINDKVPYSTLITHGFVMDEQGQKMSKSLGNVINPSTVIKGGKNEPAYGVDVLRLWVASSEYVNDINIGKNIMSQVGENIRKYRNTARFMLGNLNNFKYNQLVEYEELDLIDKYMLHETYNFGKNIKIFYDEYAFNKVVQALNNLSNVLLSAFYFDIVKDRLYADHITSQSRRNVLTVLYHHLRSEVNQLLEAARKDKIIRKILQNYYIYYKIMI
ncbi:unnamed protein product [Rhizophagus irregularis]|nr:unnamed protein product [Rhizophagus irregularis]